MVIITAIYIPPQGDTDVALFNLHDVLCRHQTQHPDAAVVVVGDFNRANLKKVMPNLHPRIMCATKGERTLDLCYTPFKRGYNVASLPPFGKSDHAAIFLLPDYKQRTVWEAVVMREVRRWSDQVEDDMQDATSDVYWGMFRSSSSDVSKFTDVVTS